VKLLSTPFRLALLIVATGQMFIASAQVPHFLDPVSYSVPGASMAVLADINGDGILDVVTANGYIAGGSGVSVLLGNGDGAFQPAKTIAAGGNPSFVAVGDFNHDGRADIAVANEPDPSSALIPPPAPGPAPDSVSILLGNGDGTFQPSIDTPTLGAVGLATADFNGDGNLDLVVATGQSSTAQVLLGNGDGTFAVSSLAVNAPTGSVIAGDFNHDGTPDLLVFNVELLGNGDGTFRVGPPITLPGPNRYVFLGDFNGDGVLDLASVASGSRGSTISEISFGLADGSFAQPFITNFRGGPHNAVAADFDGDGKADVFGAGMPPLSGLTPVGGLSLGKGDGTFNVVANGFGFSINPIQGATPFPAFAAVGDIDGNGSPDVVIATGSAILVARNTSGQPPLLAQVTANATSVLGGMSAVTGTASLGGPAPVGGAVVALASSDPAASFPNGNTIVIPAGATSANFTFSTAVVAASTPVTISGSYNSVMQTGAFTIVPPFSLQSISISPASLFGMFGGNPAVGTLTLSGPVADGTVISLVTEKPGAISIPATVSVAPGATTAAFAIAAQPVTADTPVTISASLQAVTVSGTVMVRRETASVVLTKSEYTVSKAQLKVEATSTDAVSSLQVFNASTGQLVGSMPAVGGGKFVGQFIVKAPFTTAAVQSSVGGLAIAPVPQK
jgi:hypothetical protein